MSNVTEDLTAKRVQIFKEAVPSMRRIGLLYYPEAQRGPRIVEQYREAASAFGWSWWFWKCEARLKSKLRWLVHEP